MFLIHLCEKKEYILSDSNSTEDTFLDALIKEYMGEPEFAEFTGMHFVLELAGVSEEELKVGSNAVVTNFMIKVR